jgi:hypothetical protein
MRTHHPIIILQLITSWQPAVGLTDLSPEELGVFPQWHTSTRLSRSIKHLTQVVLVWEGQHCVKALNKSCLVLLVLQRSTANGALQAISLKAHRQHTQQQALSNLSHLNITMLHINNRVSEREREKGRVCVHTWVCLRQRKRKRQQNKVS